MSLNSFISKLLKPSKESQLNKISPNLTLNDAELGDINNIIWNNILHNSELDIELGLPLNNYIEKVKTK
jgi:hypothetical protein